ncbi:hypothetical protein E2C01_020558 [Portunus trituberculatus]|uniref:Uncharacterized protein n=1 Tax=Portunus trituberculatus TaxID=210409 RepID=A0A5B7E0T5_PORTR|nr:hypothetical protein [Portunus trituberculatus]
MDGSRPLSPSAPQPFSRRLTRGTNTPSSISIDTSKFLYHNYLSTLRKENQAGRLFLHLVYRTCHENVNVLY